MTFNLSVLNLAIFFFINLLGALVQQFKASLFVPPPVIIFICGVIAGAIVVIFKITLEFIHPTIILYTFVPIVLFHSAFRLDAHLFFRSLSQCLVLAFPGLLICSILTTSLSLNIFMGYKWEIPECILFGSIISSTDPSSIIEILRGIGGSRTLITLIEGESLLNNSLSKLIFDMVLSIVASTEDVWDTTFHAICMFLQILFGGSLFGFIFGKLSIFQLSFVYNDRMTEMCTPIIATYICFYIAEISYSAGFPAVVALGLVFSSEKTSFSPEVEHLVMGSWELMRFLVDNFLFFELGMMVMKLSITEVRPSDIVISLVAYTATIVFRLMMVCFLSPILSRIGYGFNWMTAVMLTWGGIRGIIAYTLALISVESPPISNTLSSDMFIVHIGMIIMLSLIINGCTMKTVIDILGMSQISAIDRVNMSSAIKYIDEVIKKSTNVQRMDNFLADANWGWINKYTAIVDPYRKKEKKRKKNVTQSETPETHEESEEDDDMILREMICPYCAQGVLVEPTKREYMDMKKEAHHRIMKALKVNFWRHFDLGIIKRDTVRSLIGLADSSSDRGEDYVDSSVVVKAMQLHPKYHKLKKKVETIDTRKGKGFQQRNQRPTKTSYIRVCQTINNSKLFEVFIFITIITNIVIAMRTKNDKEQDDQESVVNNLINLLFVVIYLAECIIKICATSFKEYITDNWNKLDFFLVIVGVVDFVSSIFLSAFTISDSLKMARVVVKGVRMFRLLRFLRIISILKPYLTHAINQRINNLLSQSYDIGHGFLSTQEEVKENLEYLVEYCPIIMEYKHWMDKNRLAIIKEMVTLQRNNPDIAAASKTRVAARMVLNDIRFGLKERKEGGMLDEIEYEILESIVQNKIKDLRKAPTSIAPTVKPVQLLSKVDWLSNFTVVRFLEPHMQFETFAEAEIIHEQNSTPKGVRIIKSGIVKIFGEVSEDFCEGLPNVDTFRYFNSDEDVEDLLSIGHTLGLLGVLTETRFLTEAVCETDVETIFFPIQTMKKAFEEFKKPPSLLYNLWRIIALKIAIPHVRTNPFYQGWTIEKIKLHLEDAVLPDLRNTSHFTIEQGIEDVILIQGIAENQLTEETYKGPRGVPRSTDALYFPGDLKSRIVPIVLLITTENYEPPKDCEWAANTSRKSNAMNQNRYRQSNRISFVPSHGNATSNFKEDALKRMSVKNNALFSTTNASMAALYVDEPNSEISDISSENSDDLYTPSYDAGIKPSSSFDNMDRDDGQDWVKVHQKQS